MNINTGDAPTSPGQPGTLDNEPVTFTNVTNAVGLSGINGNFFSWTDYNNDDYPDLLVNGWRLFENTGPPDYNFTDVTSAANLTSGPSYGSWGDYDNDGWLDFYAPAGKNKQDRLWHNNGNSTFTDVTVEAGNVTDLYPSTAAGWGDYDRDGDIDLYVTNGEDWNDGNYIHYADVFYRNNGDGTFTDVTVAAGIDDYTNPYYGRGVAWGDYDNDGWLDIYISNYRIQPNYLWRNNHDGTFTNVAFEMGVTGDATYYGGGGPYYGHTIGSSWGDMDNDGNLDLWVSNLVHKYVGGTDIRGYICDDSNIYKNVGAPFFNFTDDRPNSTIPYKPIGGAGVFIGDEFWFSAALADIDNDGDLDVFIPQGGGEYYNVSYSFSFLFRNNGDGTYTDITVAAGVRTWCTYGGAWADYNRDGFMDLITSGKVPQASKNYEVRLYKNNGNSNNWLHVKLNGTESNAHGIGARVTVTSASGTQIRELEGGMGSHSQQNSIPVEFGLGSDTTVTELIVRWPNGNLHKLKDVSVNKMLLIIEDPAGPKIISISVNKVTAVEDEVLTFNGAANGNPASYEWDFDGDGTVDWSSASSAGPTTYAYPKAGVVNARLTVWDVTGDFGALSSTSYITVSNVAPTADAGTDLTAWEDEVVTFNASGSTDTPSDQPNLEYRWDLDDGGPVSGWYNTPYVNYSYTTNGVYDVSVTVKDDDGEMHADTVQVTVNNKPPEADAGSDMLVAEDEEILLVGAWNDTVSDLPYLTYKWDFGDGDSTTWLKDWNASHTYTELGVYEATFSVRDGFDITTDTANITVYNPTPGLNVMGDKTMKEDETVDLTGWGYDNPSDKFDLDYYWDFGDGANSGWLSNNANTTHTYTEAGLYNATLFVRDGDLASENASVIITVENVAPTVECDDDLKTNEDDEVILGGTGTDTVSDRSLLEYLWDFGDGSEQVNWSSDPESGHTYTKKGNYKAVLKVRDNNLAETEDEMFITVRNVNPTADASADSSNINENEVVKFSAARSTDTPSDKDSLNYTWDFKDGSTTYGVEVTHRFLSEGTFDVSLKVADDDDDRDGDTVRIVVMNVRPTAVFSIEGVGEIGVELTFNANGSTDSGNDMSSLRYTWDFGDGNTSIGAVVKHTYSQGGTFNVKLTIRDDNGAVHVITLPVEIEIEPETGATKTTGETFSFFGILAMVAGVTILALILSLLFFFVLRPKKKQEAITPELELPGVYTVPGILETPLEGQVMEGEVVTIPSQIHAGEIAAPAALPPSPGEVKALFCGECGHQATSEDQFCKNCGRKIRGEESEGEDESERVGEDESERVGEDESESVGEGESESVGEGESESVGEEEGESVREEESKSVGEGESESAGKKSEINDGEKDNNDLV